MRVALVCFAFLPNSGSEPGVGWRWATEMLALGWDVTVFLRRQHYERIVASGATAELDRLTLVPVGNERIETFVSKKSVLLYLYLYIWQVLAARAVAKHHGRSRFEVLQHLTYGGIRITSWLGFIGSAPSIYGPLGGGEMAPWKLVGGHGLSATLKEAVRYLANLSNHVNPAARLCFARADRILVKTADNMRFIPRKHHSKVEVLREIGATEMRTDSRTPRHGRRKILFVARSLYWKGGALAIEAFSKLSGRLEAELTMVGTGSCRPKWEALAQTLGCDRETTWIDSLERSEMGELYAQHDLFLFPSWHDSSGNVVLEAIGAGLPVVCLALGGPGEINAAAGGMTVSAEGKDTAEIATALADAIVEILSSPQRQHKIIQSGHAFIETETWRSKVLAAYEPYLDTFKRG